VLAAAGGLLVAGGVIAAVLLASSGPRAVPGKPAAMAPTWTAAQQALVARLDPTALSGCRPDASPAGSGITAAVFCATPAGRQVAVYAYQDHAALQADVTTRVNSVVPDGRCERGANEVFSWDDGPGTPTGGTAICQHRDDKEFLFWSSDSDLVAFLAYDTDPRALFDWWQSFQPLPDTTSSAPTQAARPA
jgi:hypothetical protein